jgi:hypothetical protein
MTPFPGQGREVQPDQTTTMKRQGAMGLQRGKD